VTDHADIIKLSYLGMRITNADVFNGLHVIIVVEWRRRLFKVNRR